MSGLRYEVWSSRDTDGNVRWYARARDLEYEGPFDTEEDALVWARAPEVEVEDDFTNTEFVSGAVQAQIEDLETSDKVAVLTSILDELRDPIWHLKADHDVIIFFPDWTVGYLQWKEDPEEEDGGWADVYDTKGAEAGETDSAECRTCGIELKTEGLP